MSLGEISVILAAISAVGSGVGLTLRAVHLLRTNEMHHIDLRINDVLATGQRVENKLDQHVQYHLDHKL